jgi:hypothetical protein
MGDTFNQTNQSGSIGTQGQVGHNTLNNATVADKLRPLSDELFGLMQGKEWPDETSIELKDEFGKPADMITLAMNEAEQDLEAAPAETIVLEDEAAKKSIWVTRFESLIPLGCKIASSAALAVLSTYTPASPIIAAILKTLVDEVTD